MTQAIGQNAQALFTLLHDGADFSMTLNNSLADEKDANRSDFNVFVSYREIKVINADAGPALSTPPTQEIQFLIMRFIEQLSGRNAFAIDFWANPIAQAQIWDYEA
ncbi:MAG: hypothetical protein EZS28_020135 [Streblomastix strix]|uniref:Uncharacterized protein n=1 Tax=Streblomastix strix TaxID=222440 RepID=A0A5J4VNZ2_9EUKA|nr:MAG: hypothetical protein EZS28_020135 [Streblomastix strix]